MRPEHNSRNETSVDRPKPMRALHETVDVDLKKDVLPKVMGFIIHIFRFSTVLTIVADIVFPDVIISQVDVDTQLEQDNEDVDIRETKDDDFQQFQFRVSNIPTSLVQ